VQAVQTQEDKGAAVEGRRGETMTQAEELLVEEQQLRHSYAQRAARAESFLRNVVLSSRCRCDRLWLERDKHDPNAVCLIVEGARDILKRAEGTHVPNLLTSVEDLVAEAQQYLPTTAKGEP
jgi:hypothetical protein